MKKLLLAVMLIPFLQFVHAQEEIVKWTFPSGQLSDTVQNGTNTLNLTRTIRVEGAGPITMTNGQVSGDYACTATNWDNGMDVKGWNVRFKTIGYDNVKISSKQRAGGNNGGPKDFKLQYKLGSSGTWADIPGGTVTLANDWTTGVVTDLNLPTECQNQSTTVNIQWVMASNADVLGGDVTAAGISKIDEIIVTGILLTGLDEVNQTQALRTFPNPSTSSFTIELKDESDVVEIYNSNGMTIFRTFPENNTINIGNMLPSGLYFIKATSNGKTTMIKHIVK